MTRPLMRRELQPIYNKVQDDTMEQAAHPGLLLQRGLSEHSNEDADAKRNLIDCVARQSTVADFYRRAYQRWKCATSDSKRFRSLELNLESRLFIGLTGGGIMETGCAVSHSYGVPYIPGSSVKGVASAWSREQFALSDDGASILSELFGASAASDQLAGLSGVITFHDAWWVPGSAGYPLASEVVATHHLDYYGSEGRIRATDFDSPVPNAQIAIQGSFLFTIEGPSAWLELTERMLIAALTSRGAGAKTRSGYGLFREKTAKPSSTPLGKGDAVGATLFKDDRGRWCGRTDDGLEGTVLTTAAGVPEDAEDGATRTLYVRVVKPLEFLWEKSVPKPPPKRRPNQSHRR